GGVHRAGPLGERLTRTEWIANVTRPPGRSCSSSAAEEPEHGVDPCAAGSPGAAQGSCRDQAKASAAASTKASRSPGSRLVTSEKPCAVQVNDSSSTQVPPALRMSVCSEG